LYEGATGALFDLGLKAWADLDHPTIFIVPYVMDPLFIHLIGVKVPTYCGLSMIFNHHEGADKQVALPPSPAVLGNCLYQVIL
jgi:hypothetical protein